MDIEGLSLSPFPAPRSITQVINSDDGKIEDVLNQDITFRLFRTGDLDLIRLYVSVLTPVSAPTRLNF